MEIVINIPEEIYSYVNTQWRDIPKNDSPISILCNAVIDGTPLPKEHGRLKDIDAFISKVKADREHSAYLRSWTADDVLNALDKTYAPTVIEAEFPLTDIEHSYLATVQNDINCKRRLTKSKKAYGKHVGE